MRSLRWLLLVAMVLVAAAVLGTFRSQRRALETRRQPLPPQIALDTRSSALDWEWGQSGAGMPQVHITAKDMRQSADGNKAELKDIELRIYSKDGQSYVRVRTGAAEFTTSDNKLYSPGEAQVTLDVPVTGVPAHELTSITASGINFDSKAGTAVSDQHVTFTFDGGNGTCIGASYDPASHILNLNHDVVLNLHGKGPGGASAPAGTPMKVETEDLIWNETTSVLQLQPWSRLTRDTAVINAGPATVRLKDQILNAIDAPQGQGVDNQPGRRITYSADQIHVDFDENGEYRKVSALGNAKLVSTTDVAQTTVTARYVDLSFVPEGPGGSRVLSLVNAVGNGFLESKPLPGKEAPQADPPDTRIVKANSFVLKMRPGGKDIDRIDTTAAGTVELLPNQSSHHRRLLKGDRIAMIYGPGNQIREFHASGTAAALASTETEPSAEERSRRNAVPAVTYTSSRNIDAVFGDDGQLKQLTHRADFHYRQGVRQAQSDTAELDNGRNQMNLENHARISDDTGTTVADRIRIDQSTGDFDARGHVFTTRLPDPKPAGGDSAAAGKTDSGVINSDEPVQGSADRVTTSNRNRIVRYEGNAVLWQPENRIQGDRVEIDREKKTVVAEGKVVTQFEDQPKADAAAASTVPLQPVFTLVKAQRMTYADTDLLASYFGGVDFRRPGLTVTSATLKAYLNPKDASADSRINRALSDGKVRIVESLPDRRRVGTGDHAEYYTADGKVILTGGSPQLDDTVRGNTKGNQLTYFTNDDRLLVDGLPGHQVQSHLRKKN